PRETSSMNPVRTVLPRNPLGNSGCNPQMEKTLMQGSILDHVGHTPLVPLRRLNLGLRPTICLKVESSNPGGSIKDRVAIAMIDEAERQHWLRPGGTIIEATAGKGYRCIFVMPDKMSGEKIRLLSAYGAEIVITPTSVPADSPDSYNGVADRLSREISDSWRPNQFANLANPEIHYQMTDPEIWDQTEGKITAFVAGCGTGGTISGGGAKRRQFGVGSSLLLPLHQVGKLDSWEDFQDRQAMTLFTTRSTAGTTEPMSSAPTANGICSLAISPAPRHGTLSRSSATA